MNPALKHGSIIIFIKTKSFKIGDIILVKLTDREVVKRIVNIKEDSVYIEGDNKDQSTDSRNYGWIKHYKIMGKTLWPRLNKY